MKMSEEMKAQLAQEHDMKVEKDAGTPVHGEDCRNICSQWRLMTC